MELVADRFDEFWGAYPRRTAKGAARASWVRATEKIKASPDEILAGVRRYALACVGKDPQYIAHPSTWLNQQRWLDEEAKDSAPAATFRSEPRLSGMVATSRLAHELRDKLLERSRHRAWGRIEEAGRRCNVSAAEFWGALEPELRSRAWGFALAEAGGGSPCPATLDITRDDWMEAKMRVESRVRHMRGMQQFGTSSGSVGTISSKIERRSDDGNEEQGMALAEEAGNRRIGREYPDVGGRAEDPHVMGGEDGQA